MAIPLAHVVGVGYWVKTLVAGRWSRNPGWLAGAAALLIPPAGLTWLLGVGAGGLDKPEACGLSGHEYYRDYALTHHSDSFPLHHPCNADHDLVAGWSIRRLPSRRTSVVISGDIRADRCPAATQVRPWTPAAAATLEEIRTT